ncbi:MAG: type II toxin-antitoxin system prevent-host-death family antitoxin [Betaproteobacteria bacterium]|jgi:prevent-host-death family protein|nr:MAG: type II toxin-antitoxin system prevent-host-death family antitoxin [Betaproteobacteria bacterium]
MKSLSVREVRKELAQIDELVSREGEVVVTRRGKPIARLLPLRSKRRMPSHADLRASMPRLKNGSEKLIRSERDER